MIAMLARVVGKPAEGDALIAGLVQGLDGIAASAKAFPRRPRVYFEEWPDPPISGIQWVEELVEIAGGESIFPELRACGKSKDRVVDPAAVAARDPDIILASWCGMKVKKDEIRARPGWPAMSAVRNGHVYEVCSDCILQPGPASLTEGVRQLHAIFAHAMGVEVAPALKPAEAIDRGLL
jgi:iron complex transport system substrate-binding protein